jgi:phosphoglycolate phosphatase-like HAD superfamily hydrolase
MGQTRETQFSAQGIIWDLDGTLLSGFKLYVAGLTAILQRRGIALPKPEAFVQNYHGPMRDTIYRLTGLEEETLDAVYHEFIQKEEYYYEHPEVLYFADGVRLLQRCHKAGLKQIIVSNRTHYSDERLGSPRNLAKKPPLAGMIDAVVCGDDNDFHKPDARMLDTAERTLGLSRDSFLVIGDQYVDAELAHNVGVPAVLVKREPGDIPHLDRLPDGWQNRVSIVSSLDEVSIQRG